VFGAFSPINGDSLVMEMPECNSVTFQVFLNELSKQAPEEYKILALDNGAFHKAKRLRIPDNMALLFLPPYSPELNPAEKIWWRMKRAFSNTLHNSLEELGQFIAQNVNGITPEQIISTCSFEYIFSGFNWTI
jgi:transposase